MSHKEYYTKMGTEVSIWGTQDEISYYQNYLNPLEIDKLQAWFFWQIVGQLGYNPSLVLQMTANAIIAPREDGFQCGVDHCHGEQIGNTLYIGTKGSCVYESALLHETMHWYQESILGINDYNHVRTWEWAIANQQPYQCE